MPAAAGKGKIEELGDMEVTNNEELLAWVNRARRVCHTLYLEFHWMADQLEARLSSIKGILNRRRARAIANQLRQAAEVQKQSSTYITAMWHTFERQFAKELETAKKGRTKPDGFEFTG